MPRANSAESTRAFCGLEAIHLGGGGGNRIHRSPAVLTENSVGCIVRGATEGIAMPRQGKNPPSPIDIHVGSRMRMRRMMLGWSQEKLANTFGLTFQQVQKYEKGMNRMGASRLQQAGDILGVAVPFFSKAQWAARSHQIATRPLQPTSTISSPLQTACGSRRRSCAYGPPCNGALSRL